MAGTAAISSLSQHVLSSGWAIARRYSSSLKKGMLILSRVVAAGRAERLHKGSARLAEEGGGSTPVPALFMLLTI
jgi:hypothetical protein